MRERASDQILPLFDRSRLEEYPSETKYLLKEYWRIQAGYTRAHLEEFGVPREVLVYVSTDTIRKAIAADALTMPEVFGTVEYLTEELDEKTDRIGTKLSLLCEDPLGQAIKLYSNKFFAEMKRSCIYEYSPEENIATICDANGGIPGWTQREQELIDKLK